MITRSALHYGAVSGVCLILHNLIMIAGDRAGWTMIASILVSFCASALTGYVLHSFLTFREPLQTMRFVRYAAAMTANIPLAFVALWFWHKLLGLEMVWAAPVSTLCMIGVNYILSRWAILAKTQKVT